MPWRCSRPQDFTNSCGKTVVCLVNKGPGGCIDCIHQIVKPCLTHRGRVTIIYIYTKLGHIWFRWWCCACSVPPNFSHIQSKYDIHSRPCIPKCLSRSHFVQTAIYCLLCYLTFHDNCHCAKFALSEVLDVMTRN